MTTTTETKSEPSNPNPNAQTVRAGKAGDIEVDCGRFNAEVIEYLVSIGLRNVLRDVHAGVEDPVEAREKSLAKLESLYRGETHRSGSGNGNAALKAAVAEKDARIAELEAQLAAAQKPNGKKR